jgi:hypothetical protein
VPGRGGRRQQTQKGFEWETGEAMERSPSEHLAFLLLSWFLLWFPIGLEVWEPLGSGTAHSLEAGRLFAAF